MKRVNDKGIKIISYVLIVACIMLAFAGGFVTHLLIRGKNETLDWVTKCIEENYCVYDKDGNLVEFSSGDYAKGIGSLLDQYSKYYTKEEYQAEIAYDYGNTSGVGIMILNKNSLEIGVVGNSPAEKSGLMLGDILTAVEFNGTKANVNTSAELSSELSKIDKGIDFYLYYTRNGVEGEQRVTIKKQDYKMSYVRYYDNQMTYYFTSENAEPLQSATESTDRFSYLDDDTGYIVFSQFNYNADVEFGGAMEYMKTRGKTKLILDLRYNGGGFLDVLLKVANYLIDVDSPAILYSKDKKGTSDVYRSNSQSKFNKEITKITVIANDGSASATECLIGAMLYYGTAFDVNGLVIEKNAQGEARTYGKGIMQRTFVNPIGGDALKLTVAYIYQPDGTTSIHGKGITTTQENGVEKGLGISRAMEILAS